MLTVAMARLSSDEKAVVMYILLQIRNDIDIGEMLFKKWTRVTSERTSVRFAVDSF